MKTSSITLAAATLALVLSACNGPDTNRTTSIPRGADRTSQLGTTEPTGLSAPPAQPERGPVAPDANAAAPGTNAAEAMANQPSAKDTGVSATGETKITGTSEKDQQLAVKAQEAAAKAPDTAAADEAKKQVMSRGSSSDSPGSTETAKDTDANSPRHGTVTKDEQANQLPKAGQVNNHSSTALENDSGRPSDGQATPQK